MIFRRFNIPSSNMNEKLVVVKMESLRRQKVNPFEKHQQFR